MADRVALVTGASRGIGRAIAERLAHEGADVVVNYSRSEAEAQQTREACAALGVRAQLVRADCSRESEIKEMVQRTVDALGGIDILVNNAGRTRFIPFESPPRPEALDEITDEDWDNILGLNVKGAFYASRACAPILRQRGNGLIVNVASIAGLTGKGSSIPYAVSKGALITLTKSLARALAPHVRVNAVAPGIVLTRWVAGKEEHIQRNAKDTPMERPATAEDVAPVIVSFATHATFLTGEVVVVDGGVTMR
jgi:3-oxoacyl-[acyl-carrier protein] reductase